MLCVGNLVYAGEEYYVHYCSNGSKLRFILLSKYTKEQRDMMLIEEDEVILNNIKSNSLNYTSIYKERIEKYEDYVISAFQSDKKAKSAYYIGDTNVLNKFISIYEDVIHGKYVDGEDGCTISSEGGINTKIQCVRSNGDSISFIRADVSNSFYDVQFNIGGMHYYTLQESDKSAHAAPYKKWNWNDDLKFNTDGLKRKVVSLSAKTLAQLRQEKDLSWYYNKDGSSKKDYKVLHTLEEVKEVINEIEKLRKCILLRDKNHPVPVAVDCETTGLKINSLKWIDANGEKNPLKDEIGGISLTWRFDQGVYIPFIHTKFQNVPKEECLKLLKPYLEEWYLETHNGLFDGKVFLDNAIKLNIMDDSMIMLFNIDPNVSKGSKGLKENTFIRYGHETLDHDDVFPSKESIESFYDLPEDIIKIYGCADSDYAYRLCSDLRKEIPSQKAYRLDMNVVRYLIKVNYNGNRVDDVLLNQLAPSVDEDIKLLEETMFKFVGQIGQLTQAYKLLTNSVKNGKITEAEVESTINELKQSDSFKNARYEFSPSKPDVIVDILYNQLNYPVTRVSKTSGKPSADKYALKDLQKEVIDETKEEVGTWMKEDLVSSIIKYQTDVSLSDKILISADEFNRKKYPFVLLLLKWKELMKLKTTFFAWFLNGSCDNMYYSDFSMTNAETSRIIGRVQTLKGAMKKLIVPYSDEWYLLGVDFSQIEARLMAWLAGAWDLVYRLCNPRADYHVESAAILTGKESWQITKDERGNLKAVNFAVPYGMREYSLAENLFGRPVTREKINKAIILLEQWKRSNPEIQGLLDGYRKFAVDMHECLMFDEITRRVNRSKSRYIMDKAGRRRYFNKGKYFGDILSNKAIESIRRMAGNYPIQAYAAEIFKTAFVRICKRLEKEGLDDKVHINALVHDEFLFNVHKSVDKYKLYQIIWEEMVQEIYLPYKDEDGNWVKDDKGNWVLDREHPVKYFYAGISIGPEWHDIHSNDAHEAPTEYLMYMVDRIKSGDYKFKDYESGDVTEECFNETREFMRDLIMKECFKIQPDLRPDNVKFNKIVPAFFDYFLKGKLKIYQSQMHREHDGSAEDEIRARLETLMMELWNVSTLYCYDNDSDEYRIAYVNVDSDDVDVKNAIANNVITLDIDNDDSDVDDFDLFGDLLDEDLTNFEDEDDYEDFGISIPIGVVKKEDGKDYKLLGRRTDPNDKRNIWDLVQFNQNVGTHKVDDSAKIMIRSDTVYIDISGALEDSVRNLIKYLKSISINKNMNSFHVEFRLNNRTKDTDIYIGAVNKEEICKIMNWKLSDMFV